MMRFFKNVYHGIVKRVHKLIFGEKMIPHNTPESEVGLPPELIVFIANKLPIKSVVQLAQINKETYTLLSQVPYKIKDKPETYKLRTLGFPYYDVLLFNHRRKNFYKAILPWFKLDLEYYPGLVLSLFSISGALCLVALSVTTTFNSTKLLYTQSLASALFGGFFMSAGCVALPAASIFVTGKFADYIYNKIEQEIIGLSEQNLEHTRNLRNRIHQEYISIEFK